MNIKLKPLSSEGHDTFIRDNVFSKNLELILTNCYLVYIIYIDNRFGYFVERQGSKWKNFWR